MEIICAKVAHNKGKLSLMVDTNVVTPLFLLEQIGVDWLDGTTMLNGRSLEFFELSMPLSELCIHEDCHVVFCPRKIGKDGLI